MKLTNEFKLLVILGAWNRSIFSKEWIEKYLLPNDEFSIEFSLDLDGSHRVSSSKIRIEFHNNRLNFIPIKNDIETFDLITDLAVKIADYLPHTPVFGYGINFSFESEINASIAQLIKIGDEDRLKENKIEIISSNLGHKLRYNDILVNLSIMKNEKLFFEFNFHTDIVNMTQFKDKIYENNIVSMRNASIEILNSVYDVEIDGK